MSEQHATAPRDRSASDCADFLERIVYFLDNELDEADCSAVRLHLDDCNPCLEKYDLQRTVKAVVARSCSEPAPDDAARARAAADPRGPGPHRRRLTRRRPARSRHPARRREPPASRPGARSCALRGQQRSGVGALAVVRALLLASAALAAGLAHGVLLVDRVCRPSSAPGEGPSGHPLKPRARGDRQSGHRAQSRARNRSASTTTRVTSPVATTLPGAGRAVDVPGGDGEAVQPPVDVRRARRSPRPRWPTGLAARCSSCDAGADAGRALGQRRLDRGAGGGLAPREQPRGAQHGQAARADAPPRCRPSVTVKRQRGLAPVPVSVLLQVRAEGDQVDPGDRLPVPLRGRARSRAGRRAGARRSSAAGSRARPPWPPRSRNRSRHVAAPAPRRRPSRWAPGATASIRNSPSSSPASSRHGEPGGQ